MKIEDFLSNDAFTMVNKKLAKTIWIWQAIYLQELISQRKRFWGEEFYFTQNNMEDELWISTKTQQRYANELKEKWLINFDRKWIPARNYYTINDDAIIDLFPNGKTSSVKMSELEQSNWPDYYNNNKESNKKENSSGQTKSLSLNKNLSARLTNTCIGDLTFTENVIERLEEYNNTRKKKLEKLTDKWFKLVIDKIVKFGHWTEEWMIAVLKQSVENGWEWLYEVKWFKPKVDYEKDLQLFLTRLKTDYEWLKKELGNDKFFELKKKALEYWAVNKLL